MYDMNEENFCSYMKEYDEIIFVYYDKWINGKWVEMWFD